MVAEDWDAYPFVGRHAAAAAADCTIDPVDGALMQKSRYPLAMYADIGLGSHPMSQEFTSKSNGRVRS